MQVQTISVPFDGDMLVLINHNNEPMVAMKPIVENMGLDWHSQRQKINERFKTTEVLSTSVAEDGKNREMICLPLRKIPGWLYSLNVSRVKPELREKITRYQNECDDVLWDYWTQGGTKSGVVQIQMLAPRDPTPIIADGYTPMNLKTRDLVTLQQQKYKIMRQIEETESPAVRAGLYADLRRISDALGTDVPELDAFAFPKAQKPLLIED